MHMLRFPNYGDPQTGWPLIANPPNMDFRKPPFGIFQSRWCSTIFGNTHDRVLRWNEYLHKRCFYFCWGYCIFVCRVIQYCFPNLKYACWFLECVQASSLGHGLIWDLKQAYTPLDSMFPPVYQVTIDLFTWTSLKTKMWY